MKGSVSVVIPCLDDTELLEANLPPLLEELERRARGDEVIVVDDTGKDVLSAWLAGEFPAVRCVAREENGGFAAALTSGVEAASHELVFSMNPDVRVRPGFLDPLVACMGEEDVHSVAPRVLLDGDEERVESLTEIDSTGGLGRVRQRGLEGEASRFVGEAVPVAYAIGGTCLLRRAAFLADGGGFDPLYEPFYWEDVDLGWQAWRSGGRVLYQPASVVEHHHRGTIGRLVPRPLVVATIERNRLLFQWKSIDDEGELAEHYAGMMRMAVDAWMTGDREPLVWLALALEDAGRARASREAMGPAARTYAEIREASRPRLAREDRS
jgi:GT2 family glycosyltransferase